VHALALLFTLAVLGGGGGLNAVADLQTPRAAHTATALPDGRVLVAGGCIDPGCETATATTELYDLDTRRSVRGPKLGRSRVGHAAVALRDGSVLLLGGFGGRTPTASVERFVEGRIVEGRIVSVAPMGSRASRHKHAAVTLRDGRFSFSAARMPATSGAATGRRRSGARRRSGSGRRRPFVNRASSCQMRPFACRRATSWSQAVASRSSAAVQEAVSSSPGPSAGPSRSRRPR